MNKPSVWMISLNYLDDPEKPKSYRRTARELLIANNVEDAIDTVKRHYRDKRITDLNIYGVNHHGTLTI